MSAASYCKSRDVVHEFSLLVGNQPSIESATSDRPRPTIEHYSAFRKLNQQARAAVSQGVHGVDSQGSKTNSAGSHSQMLLAVDVTMPNTGEKCITLSHRGYVTPTISDVLAEMMMCYRAQQCADKRAYRT
jgi:hypothetical protein